jgi:hypothetical protein
MNLAPNGKKSNLTNEQYKLVRTPAFKKWFGDWENSPQTASKVIDENGEPLVVYHGSNQKNIAEFKTITTKNIGAFFTENKALAKKYGKTLYAVFLDIKKPKVFNAEFANYHDDQTYYDYKLQEAFYETDNDGYKKYDGFRYVNFYDSPRKGDTPMLNNGLAVFSSEQIKLADGTNTTFDANNNDIRYKNGGNINTFNYSVGGL